MQRERDGGEDSFHSDEALGSFGGFGSFASHRSMFPSLFGGRDPFDDPFFSRPFDTMFQSRMFSPNPASGDTVETGTEKGIVIEELRSDDEEQEDEGTGNEKHNTHKYSRSNKEPSVEHPDDLADGN